LNNRSSPVRAIANLELNLIDRPGIVDFAFDADSGRVFLASREARITVWNINGGTRLARAWSGNALPVVNVDYAEDALYLLDNSANIEDAVTTVYIQSGESAEARRIELVEETPRLVRAMALNVVHGLIATSGADIIIYNVADGSILQELPIVHADVIGASAFSRDGQWLFTGDDSGLIVAWQRDASDEWIQAETITAHEGRIWDVAVHPDGTEMVTVGEDQTVKRWQVGDDAIVAVPEGEFSHDNEVLTAAYSLDGRWLATGDRDGIIFVTDRNTPDAERIRLSGHANLITDLAFSPDSQRLASGSRDRSVRLWEFDAAGAMRPLDDELVGPGAAINALAFSPDGTQLTVSYNDLSVINWDVGLVDWTSIACGIANRNFTDDEVDRFLFGGAVPPIDCTQG